MHIRRVKLSHRGSGHTCGCGDIVHVNHVGHVRFLLAPARLSTFHGISNASRVLCGCLPSEFSLYQLDARFVQHLRTKGQMSLKAEELSSAKCA